VNTLPSTCHTQTVKHAAGMYRVVIGNSVLPLLPVLLPDTIHRGRICIVADERVAGIYENSVSGILKSAGIEQTDSFTFPPGEKSKSLSILKRLLHHLALHGITRTDSILGLGGGVTGDLAGFAASIYMRGISHILIPTTLLAQADSAIGGKTGINLPLGKNLVGSFHAPVLALCDLKTLDTLPIRHIRNGFAEIVKMALLGDPGLFEFLETHAGSITRMRGRAELTQALIASNQLKCRIVEQDEKESGIRIHLNLGHTFAHGLECVAGYRKLFHGEAVAIGLIAATRLAVALSICQQEVLDRLTSLLEQTGLPLHARGLNTQAIPEILMRDKKTRSGRLRLVLPERIGCVTVVDDVDPALLKQCLDA
jgi:3-dehydroquinate synthase